MLTATVALLLAATPPSVMVLYFDNDSGRPELDVMKKGMADMLITDLSAFLPVVERERLDVLIKELELQRTRYFDPKTAQRLGKLLAATHAVTGSIAKVDPKLRLDVRLIEISTSKVLASGQVVGDADDLFGLEQQLVDKFLKAIDAKAKSAELRTGKTSLKALVAYSQGLDLADRGELVAAQSKLAEVVREQPDFTRAKEKYAELIKRVREAEKKRGAGLSDNERKLQAHIDAWKAKKLDGSDPELWFGYRFAQLNLHLWRMRRLLDVAGAHDQNVWVPPSKRAELEKLEQAFIDDTERLIVDLRAYRKLGRARNLTTGLSEEDDALGRELTDAHLDDYSFSSAASTSLDLGAYLLTGTTPYDAAIDRFTVRPSPAQRNPALAKRGEALLAQAARELPQDSDADEVVTKHAELQDALAERFVADARKEDAVAQLQLFLDQYPKSDRFPLLKKKLEHLLLISDEVERAQAQVKACDITVDLFTLARRTTRADGPAGLVALGAQTLACAKKDVRWGELTFTASANAAVDLADCKAYADVKARAAKANVPLTGVKKHTCDEP